MMDNFYYLLMVFFVSSAIVSLVFRRRIARESDDARRLYRQIRFDMNLFCCAALFLMFCLPSTPSLSSFGYPNDITEVDTPQKVLNYFQEYNRAIERTIKVVHFFIFVFVFWFFGSMSVNLKRAFNLFERRTIQNDLNKDLPAEDSQITQLRAAVRSEDDFISRWLRKMRNRSDRDPLD